MTAQRFQIGFACVLIVVSATQLRAQDSKQLAQQAKAVLQKHCYHCHGENGIQEGGLHVLDWKRLTSDGKATKAGEAAVVPRQPKQSNLLARMQNGDMPPDAESDQRAKNVPRPDAAAIAVIEQWIKAGAPNFDEEIRREFISPEKMLGFIANDLRKNVRERDHRFTRYFTLTHLHNDFDIPNDEIARHCLGLSNLINGLSWAPDVTIPKPIDPAQTILRIDVRDYNWGEESRKASGGKAVWDLLIAYCPYNLVYDALESYRFCAERTQCPVPYVRGDWFVAASSRPPLYHEILEIPAKVSELEKRLEVNVDANIAGERVARAGFTQSGVSDHNRMIERHRSAYGAYWKSYDFAGTQGRKLLTAHPLGPGSDSHFFEHDGGEVIFSLPNKLQAYMLIKADGSRICAGPTNIVRDNESRDEGKVVNGISCMRCHHQGMVFKDDEIRSYVLANEQVVFKDQPGISALIQELYPSKEKFDALLLKDANTHIAAVAETGSPVQKAAETGRLQLQDGMPVVRLARHFEDDLDLNLAAAEAGTQPAQFRQALSQSSDLTQQLGLLLVPNKKVKRETFVAAFETLQRELKLARYIAPTLRGGSISGTSGGSRALAAEVTNSIGMKLRLIPAGDFNMGSPASEEGRSEDEKSHSVKITKPFYLAATEVTQGQWQAVMQTKPWDGKEYVKEGRDFPATYVSWDDAQEFCRKLSEKEQASYRLPTEAEWEYACRAGTTGRFHFDGGEAALGDYAWFDKNAYDIDAKFAHGVALKKPNAFGLFDMHGNVWEWCEDVYVTEPPSGENPLVETGGSARVLRGGGWRNSAADCRSAFRCWDSDGYRSDLLGFRPARSPSGK